MRCPVLSVTSCKTLRATSPSSKLPVTLLRGWSLDTVLNLNVVAEGSIETSSPEELLLPAELNTAGKRVDQVHTLAGSSKLQQQLCGLMFQLSPLAFFQTNSKQTEVLYNEIALASGTFSRLPTRPAIRERAPLIWLCHIRTCCMQP